MKEKRYKDMEQMKKELEEMMQKIYANEKALKYLHGFVKMMISRYGIQWLVEIYSKKKAGFTYNISII